MTVLAKKSRGSAGLYRTVGASNHTQHEREKHDYYATNPKAATLLLELETFSPNIWECACGEGHLSKEFIAAGFNVKSTDIVDRGFGGVHDFIGLERPAWTGDIITNPPFKYAREFILRALEIIPTGYKVAMFLKVQFMEGQKRKSLFVNFPPKTIYVSSSRLDCAMNGDFEALEDCGGGAVAYAWYVWEKGFQGDTIIKWFN